MSLKYKNSEGNIVDIPTSTNLPDGVIVRGGDYEQTEGIPRDADRLGGQEPSYYATSAALSGKANVSHTHSTYAKILRLQTTITNGATSASISLPIGYTPDNTSIISYGYVYRGYRIQFINEVSKIDMQTQEGTTVVNFTFSTSMVGCTIFVDIANVGATISA